MASDSKFSDWYFTFCKANNRTPSQEEVWNSALAQPAPVQQDAPAPSMVGDAKGGA